MMQRDCKSHMQMAGTALILIILLWLPVGPLTANNIMMLRRSLSVHCVGSIQNFNQLYVHLPPAVAQKGRAAGKQPASLAPGLSWLGNHVLLAAASFGGVQWKLSGDYRKYGTMSLPKPPEPAIRLLHSGQGIFLCSLGAHGGYRDLKLWHYSPQSPSGYRSSGIRMWRLRDNTREPHYPWMSLECPENGNWFCALPEIPSGRSVGVIGYLPPASGALTTFALDEPHNRAFCSPDGRFLGLTSGGHWLRVLHVGLPHAQWHMIRVRSRVPLRFGSFSSDGGWAVLTTAARGRGPAGGPVEIILLSRSKPGSEWIGHPWAGQMYRALASCPPAISADGRQIAVDMFRPRGLAKPHGQDIFLYAGKKRKLAGIVRLKGDIAQHLAFSPDGKYLAVECWYRILLFRCRPAGPGIAYWNAGRGMREIKLTADKENNATLW